MGSQGAHGAGGQPAVPQGTGTVPAAAPGGRRHWSLVPGSVIFPGPLPDVGRWCQQGWEVGGTWVRDQGGILSRAPHRTGSSLGMAPSQPAVPRLGDTYRVSPPQQDAMGSVTVADAISGWRSHGWHCTIP